MSSRHVAHWLAVLALCLFAIGPATAADQSRADYKASSKAVSDIQSADQLKTAETFKRLYAAVPPPEIKDSVERRQLVKRLLRFNVQSKISYIYLINYGKVMGFFVVQGKVSSVNSMLSCTQQLVDDGQGSVRGDNGRDNVHVVESPDLDGSYGSNGDAIFFFTDKDIYVEWNGTYFLCDQFIEMTTPPELHIDLGAVKSAQG